MRSFFGGIFEWRLVKNCIGFCALFFVGPLAHGFELEIEGDLTQGSLVQGRTDAEVVDIFDQKVRVDADGRFVFGLGRDAAKTLVLTLHKGEVREEKTLSVHARHYNIQKITGVEDKYVNPPQAVLARIIRDVAEVKKARAINRDSDEFRTQFQMPAKGPITGVYGSQRIFNGVPKRPHYGLDIAGPVGTEVRAPAAGLVTLAEPDMYYSGGTLIVDHGQGVSSTFIHLSKILVKVGDYVGQGQVIARIGQSGRATGPHLDWRVNWFDQRLDPELVLQGKYLQRETSGEHKE